MPIPYYTEEDFYLAKRIKLAKEIHEVFNIEPIFENKLCIGYKGDIHRLIEYCIDLELKKIVNQ